MKRSVNWLVLAAWLLTLWLPFAPAAAAAPGPQSSQPAATPLPPPADSAEIRAMMDKMSVADKVGQLFVVTFTGNDVGDDSDIATLVRDYRVGGVVLSPGDDNFRDAQASVDVNGQPTTLSAPQQVLQLSNRLQTLAWSPARPISPTQTVTPTKGTPAPTVTVAPPTATPTPTPQPTRGNEKLPAKPGVFDGHVPLLVGIDWAGDDSSIFSGAGGYTPFPSEMAVGATWSTSLAERVGQMAGQELQATGINLLLGPSLDVLDVPRPESKGDLRTRSFGGDPFWTGQMGQSFIRGIQEASNNGVLTAAKHFPGQGDSDRRPEDEVATVQKSLQQLRQIEMAPFMTVAGSDLTQPGVTGAMMTSHVRYRGFQGNIRQLTPPISLAPQLQDLMGLPEFSPWRAAGGILMSDALGVPAVRRYYDPQLQKFPYRQVAQDAFLAGNDLLYLSRFALTDNWPDQFQAIKETVLFFQSKYQDDSQFRARVDASVERILRMKRRIYQSDWSQASVMRDPGRLDSLVGRSMSVPYAVARTGTSLIYPGRDELADRMPSAPLTDDRIVVFTDAREARDCAACPSVPQISPTALQDVMLRLYGPNATAQLLPDHIKSYTFADLNRILSGSGNPDDRSKEIESAISSAQWLLFATLDTNAIDHPDSEALRSFLAKRSDGLRDKRLVVMAFDAPYYLDTTEMSKLTAYYGVYAKSPPFIETAVRALFREYSPIGYPPVSVSGINYELINQLEPASGQVISLDLVGDPAGTGSSIQVGSKLQVQTGIILDGNGHPVPDGTPVEFRLRYPTEALQLAPTVEQTVAGRARTTVTLDRAGELWITAASGAANDSTRIVLRVGGDQPGSIATVMPTITPVPTATATLEPTPTMTPEPSPTAQPAPAAPTEPPETKPRVALSAFLYAVVGVLLSSGSAFTMRRRQAPLDTNAARQTVPDSAVAAALWAASIAWLAYLLYAYGWLPGATAAQEAGSSWVAGAVTLVGGLVSVLWTCGTAEKLARKIMPVWRSVWQRIHAIPERVAAAQHRKNP